MILSEIAECTESWGRVVEAAPDRLSCPQVLPSFGERYLSTVLFNNLWSSDADAESRMPTSWRDRSGVEQCESKEAKL